MGYRIRVLGTKDKQVSISDLQRAVTSNGGKVATRLEDGNEDHWNQVTFTHQPNGSEIMLVERDLVIDGELGAEELEEFIDEVQEYEPRSAADWLRSYLPQVKVIYSLQLLSGTEVHDGWSVVHSVQSAIWNKVGGILQADGEGFSNENGHTILWQFGNNVSGAWKVAVLNDRKKWVPFEMELGNTEHRQAFLRGQVPKGVKLL